MGPVKGPQTKMDNAGGLVAVIVRPGDARRQVRQHAFIETLGQDITPGSQREICGTKAISTITANSAR